MDFDNLLEDSNLQYLSKKLPQLIKNEFSKESFLNISDAPKIIPATFKKNSNLKDGVIINGKYFLSNNLIFVSFEAYDVDTWDKQASRTYYCDSEDEECIEQALLVCIKEDVIPLFCSYYDCLGVCNGSSKVDCLGVCNGDAITDCVGICNGEHKIDCNGECSGNALLDHCGECDYDSSNDCQIDCNGDWGGDAFLNVCNVCVEGNTGLDISHRLDCLGNCNGTAKIDCNGECMGNAYINDCNVCVGGNTGNLVIAGFDCEGNCFGDSLFDQCGIRNGDNSSCSDCKGIPNGNALEDNCGNCDYTTVNDCIQDCHGDWGGSAYLNKCLVCVGGNTGFVSDKGIDCNGVCWGNAKVDSCGACNGNDVCNQEVTIEYKEEKRYEEISKKYFHQNSNSKRFFKHSSKNDFNSNNKDLNTQYLLNIIDDLKYDLYSINISDFKETFVEDKVVLEIPVNYSINKNFLTQFKFIKGDNNEDNFVYRLSNTKFDISLELEKYLSTMKYQLVPVLFFSNSNDKILLMLIDSWTDNYHFSFGLKDNKKILTTSQFKTLFSITPGESALQFNLDKGSFDNVYELSLLIDEYKNFDYMFIKFFNEHNLESEIYHYILNSG